jgi:RNA polymerase primary sigma factor
MKNYTDIFYKTQGRKPTLSELANYMNMSEKQIDNLFSSMFMDNLKSSNEIVAGTDDCTLEEIIQDPENKYDKIMDIIQLNQLQSVLWEIVDSLDADQGKVIRERYQNNISVNDMAVLMGTTPSAIRTIEHKAFRELRKEKNRRKLEPFHISDSHIFSISVNRTGLSSFERTWTSSTERAALIAENE